MASWLEAVAADSGDVVAEGVAEHYATALASLPALAAGDLPDRRALSVAAASWFERAAEAALALSAPDTAARMFGHAIEHTDATDAALGRRRRRLGETLAASADLAAGVAEMEAALALLAEPGADAAELATTAFTLAFAYMQQVRFADAEALTGSTLERLAGEPPAARARLQALHAWAVAAQGRTEGVLDEADGAWRAAGTTGDPALELDVMIHAASARGEIDDASEDDWEAIERRATQLGRWQQAAIAGRVRAVIVGDTDPQRATAMLEDVARLAEAHGQTEQMGWARHSRCDLLLLLGGWDQALEIGVPVLDLADRYGYERLAFRTWVALLPIAAARRNGALIERFERWWSTWLTGAPVSPSPYARMLRGAIDVWMAEGSGRAVPTPPDDIVDAWAPMVNPHFCAAAETVVTAWIDAGRNDLATRVADAATANVAEGGATPLMQASAAIMRGLLGEPAELERAATLAAAIPAPWWELRARRALGQPVDDLAKRLGLG
jgi:hypothetical protein